MKLVARVLYSENITKDILILNKELHIIDNFTSKFSRDGLKIKLQEFSNQKIDIKIREIYIADENDSRIGALYSDHSFFTLSENRKEIYRMLKYIDLDRVYAYFEEKSLYDKDFENLCKEIERCNFKPDSRYYALFATIFDKDYEKLRDLMLHVFSKEELSKFHNPQSESSILDEKIFNKFLRNVLSNIPSKSEIESKTNHNSYDSLEDDENSYASNIASNPNLSLEEKMIELQILLNDPEEIRKYLN